MPLITGQTLIEAGWIPGPKFPALLAAAADYESRGIHDVSYLLKLLKSQAESLKELNLVGRRVDLIFEESMFDLWSVLSSMPNLTKLQWAGQSSLQQQCLNL